MYNNTSLKWRETHINYILVHAGQHYDIEMSQTFFHDLALPCTDMNLEVGSSSHAVQTGKIIIRFEKVSFREKLDWVIEVGNVNSTLACALFAVTFGIKVGHVEARLRSFDRSMPEEMNRLVTDAVTDLLFTPLEDADENFMKERVQLHKIKRFGNVMIDTLLTHLGRARRSKPYKKFCFREKNYAYVILYRPSNVDNIDSLSYIIEFLSKLSQELSIIFTHPRTKKNSIQFGF
ncbi:MAG: UDP-N-acetyl glucosamine 2-epimerase [Candidatus Hodarchaeota archaeon]